ncbi:centromere/kinetochore protein zw10 homolog [Hetaerina americana]|uniref:centromere/kinetochore protein zw10 homolog n=1 Tax=Hetaerina americana TaxID=62018 RepID=UPI003A7F1CB0
MSSFVAQVLAEKERVDLEDLERESYNLLNDALSLKHDYIDALECHYVKLIKPLNSTVYIISFQILHTSCRAISQTLEEVQPTPTFSAVQLETLSATIEEVKGYVSILKQLTDLDSTLSNAKMHYDSRDFLESAKKLGLFRTMLAEEASTEIITLVEAMKREWTNLCGSLMYDLTHIWREFISLKNMPRSSGKNLKVVRLNSSLDDKKRFLMAVEAMKHVDLQDHMVKTWGSMLLEQIFKPLIEHECIVTKEVNYSVSMAHLEIMIKEDSQSPTYAVVLHNCKLVFEYLDENVNIQISEDGNFLNMVGTFIDRKFCKLIFKMSFFDSKDFETFSSDVKATEGLKRYLHEIGFIQCDVSSQGQHSYEMFDYLKNCAILEEANSMMHKKIFETVVVKHMLTLKHQYYKGIFKKVGPISEDASEKWENMPNQLIISKSTQDIMDKVSQLLELAITKENVECYKLMYTVKNIFEMYAMSLPEECEELARNSAHFSAIIFNNCSHLCEWIVSLGAKYDGHFPQMGDSIIKFAEEAICIQNVGMNIFQSYVTSQITQLTVKINESEISRKGFSKHEESVKECINTIKILKSTWEHVLAYDVYVKVMVEIIYSVIKEWTMKIFLTERISPDLAASLRVLIQDIMTNLKMNFTKEELLMVKYLEKLNSIKVVLEGSSFEIIHKWRKGNGPLATCITIDEMKKLVRSFFEDDDVVYILNNLQ